MEFLMEEMDRECPDMEYETIKEFKIDIKMGENRADMHVALERQIEKDVCEGCKYFEKCYIPILSLDCEDPINCEVIPEIIKVLNKIKEIYDLKKFNEIIKINDELIKDFDSNISSIK